MIVRIRGVEVVCETLEELDRIIERYGEGGDGSGPKLTAGIPASNASRGAASVDVALLRALLNAPAGVQSPTVQGMLRARGKAIPAAFKSWCERMHLPHDAVEPAYPGGKRGWRLTAGGRQAAQAVLNA